MMMIDDDDNYGDDYDSRPFVSGVLLGLLLSSALWALIALAWMLLQ